MRPDAKLPDLDAIVFDLGNVLLDYHPLQTLRAHYPEAVAQRLHAAMFQSPQWVEMDRGVLTQAEVLARILADAPDIAPYGEAAMALQTEMITPNAPALAWLPRLKSAGYRLYALSNFGAQSFARVQARYPVFGDFDGLVISGRELVVKPAPHIYRALLSRYGLTPARALFFDDIPANVQGALDVGMQARLYTGPNDLAGLLA
ncbi:MAG: HAD family phosphatase [Oscillospiraceae bacterium]|jgi:putative hydrolase of the HAD superfamily|nr:HAD family phosphatase [Oscillospiraceae bacterium]